MDTPLEQLAAALVIADLKPLVHLAREIAREMRS